MCCTPTGSYLFICFFKPLHTACIHLIRCYMLGVWRCTKITVWGYPLTQIQTDILLHTAFGHWETKVILNWWIKWPGVFSSSGYLFRSELVREPRKLGYPKSCEQEEIVIMPPLYVEENQISFENPPVCRLSRQTGYCIASRASLKKTAYAQSLTGARYFLLHLKMSIVSGCFSH